MYGVSIVSILEKCDHVRMALHCMNFIQVLAWPLIPTLPITIEQDVHGIPTEAGVLEGYVLEYSMKVQLRASS